MNFIIHIAQGFSTLACGLYHYGGGRGEPVHCGMFDMALASTGWMSVASPLPNCENQECLQTLPNAP